MQQGLLGKRISVWHVDLTPSIPIVISKTPSLIKTGYFFKGNCRYCQEANKATVSRDNFIFHTLDNSLFVRPVPLNWVLFILHAAIHLRLTLQCFNSIQCIFVYHHKLHGSNSSTIIQNKLATMRDDEAPARTNVVQMAIQFFMFLCFTSKFAGAIKHRHKALNTHARDIFCNNPNKKHYQCFW